METEIRNDCAQPLISVIVPVYNCKPYLLRCLQSLMDQTMQDIEFILVNNGSTDGSDVLLKNCARKDARFKYILQENQGVRGSRNAGLCAARGIYLGFVDGDDFVEAHMFETLYRRIAETDSDVAICDYAMTYTDRESPSVLGLTDEAVDAGIMGMELFYLRYLCRNPTLWNKLYRRSVIAENNLLFEVDYGEDMLFHLRLAPYLSKACTVGQSLYHYVQRTDSITHSSKKVMDGARNLLSHYLNVLPENDSGLYPYYAFSSIVTGFMFSSLCIGKNLDFFREQIKLFQICPIFKKFSYKISKTNELEALYLEKIISKRFYCIMQILFGLCLEDHTESAAKFMWLCAKLIILKKRMPLFRK